MGVLERYFPQAMNRRSLHLLYNRTPFLLSGGLRSARFIILLSGTVIQISRYFCFLVPSCLVHIKAIRHPHHPFFLMEDFTRHMNIIH